MSKSSLDMWNKVCQQNHYDWKSQTMPYHTVITSYTLLCPCYSQINVYCTIPGTFHEDEEDKSITSRHTMSSTSTRNHEHGNGNMCSNYHVNFKMTFFLFHIESLTHPDNMMPYSMGTWELIFPLMAFLKNFSCWHWQYEYWACSYFTGRHSINYGTSLKILGELPT